MHFDLVKEISQIVNKYVQSLNPCGMCRYKKYSAKPDWCERCCFHWSSRFELDTKIKAEREITEDSACADKAWENIFLND